MTALTLIGIGATVDDVTGGLATPTLNIPMTAAGSTLTVTAALHAGKTIQLNVLTGSVCTLPAATGTGNKYRFVVSTVNTSNSHKVQVSSSTDVLGGGIINCDTDTANATLMFPTVAASDTVTLNGTTTGGASIGDWVLIEDIKTGVFHVSGMVQGTGTVATPFSAAV